MNWKYSIDREDIILSVEEHDKVQAGIATGSDIISLRDNILGIAPKAIRKWKPTDELTDEQEQQRLRQFKLPEISQYTEQWERKSGQGFMRATHEEFYQRMGWEHKKNCICKS